MLFALPFAGFGVFMAWRLAGMLWLAAAAQSWVETPATLTRLGLQRGETEKVTASYAYEFNGQRYEHDRVGLSTDSDNVGSYHKDLYQRLKKLKDAGRPATCYVNPDDPAQALLDRTVRPLLVLFYSMFMLLFVGAGFGMMIGGVVVSRGKQKRKAKLAEHPDEPWRVRDDWAAGEVRSGGWAPVLFMGGFALVWNLISWTVTLAFLNDDKNVPPWAYLILYGFPVIGLVLIGVTGYQLLRLLRYGRSTFRLGTPTGVVGGELAGVVLAPESVQPTGPFRVTLACRQTHTTQRGGESETSTVTLWEDTRLIDRTLHDPSGKRGVPVRFVVPSGEKPTDPDGDRPVAWKLSVEAPTAGPDYQAEFEVPVFVTADSKEGVTASTDAVSEYELVETLPQMLAREGLLCEQPTDAELRVTKPPGRHWGMAIGMFLGGAIFVGVGVGMLWVDEWFVKIVFPIAFGGGGLAVLAGGVGCLLSSSDLRIDGDRWRLKSGWYGFRGQGLEFSAGDIKRIGVKSSMSSNNGNQQTQWNHVVAHLRSGKKGTLVRGLKTRSTERRLLKELRRRAGLLAESPAEDATDGGGWSSYDGLEDTPGG